MTAEHLDIALRAFVRRVPFQTFLIEFVNGQQLRVTHAEAARFRGGLVHHISPRHEHQIFDHTVVHRVADLPAGDAS